MCELGDDARLRDARDTDGLAGSALQDEARLSVEPVFPQFSLRPDDATVGGSKRDDGRFGFVAIELDVALETSPERIEAAERAAEAAEERCLVSMALDIPCTSRSPLAAKAIT